MKTLRCTLPAEEVTHIRIAIADRDKINAIARREQMHVHQLVAFWVQNHDRLVAASEVPA